MKRSCSLCCSDAVVYLVSYFLSVEYGSSVGGLINTSRTSAAYSGEREETTWSNLNLCEVIQRQANCASTCVNQSLGCAGQNGGSLSRTDTLGVETAREVGAAMGEEPEACPSASKLEELLHNIAVQFVCRGQWRKLEQNGYVGGGDGQRSRRSDGKTTRSMSISIQTRRITSQHSCTVCLSRSPVVGMLTN